MSWSLLNAARKSIHAPLSRSRPNFQCYSLPHVVRFFSTALLVGSFKVTGCIGLFVPSTVPSKVGAEPARKQKRIFFRASELDTIGDLMGFSKAYGSLALLIGSHARGLANLIACLLQ